MRKHHVLPRRLQDRENDYLRFTADQRVPFKRQRSRMGNQDEQAPDRSIRLLSAAGRHEKMAIT